MRSIRAFYLGLTLFIMLVSCHGFPGGNRVQSGGESSVEVVESKVALLSFFPKLGALTENIATLENLVEEALRNGANIVVAPELATTGYSITPEQVRNGLGLAPPFQQLQRLRDLADTYKAYIFVGFAEIAPGSPSAKLYNSVIVLGPGGLAQVQRKRSIPLWHGRGDLPFTVISTPYGELAPIICADSYLMDWSRISTLSGADILLSSANWWGNNDQEKIWQTRSEENGVWMVVANRWGQEVDRRSGSPSTYEMNDSPSVVISPDGKLRLHYSE